MLTETSGAGAGRVGVGTGPRPLRIILNCVLLLSFVLEFVFWAAFLFSSLSTRMDFRRLYVAGYMVRCGQAHHLYEREIQRSFQNSLVSPEPGVAIFDHLPFGSLWFVPFSLLPYKYAYFAWLFVNIILLLISFRLLRPWIQVAKDRAWLPRVIFLSFLPVQVALLQGQDSILLLLLLSAAFFLFARNREFAAGGITALGLFKFQIILPVAAFFLLKRKFKFAITFSIASVMLTLLSAYIVGFIQMKLYWRLLTHMSLDSGENGSLREAVIPSDIATLRGLMSAMGTGHFSPKTIQISAVALSAMLVLIVAVCTPKILASTKLFSIGVLAAVLSGYHVLTHDMSITLLPILFVLGDCSNNSSWLTYSAVALLSAPLIKFVMPHHFYLVSLVLIEFLGTLVFVCRQQSIYLVEKSNERNC